jgi:hypothetical protein
VRTGKQSARVQCGCGFRWCRALLAPPEEFLSGQFPFGRGSAGSEASHAVYETAVRDMPRYWQEPAEYTKTTVASGCDLLRALPP